MRLRFPMFFKFLIGCLTLAALLIIGGILVVRSETTVRSRAGYLDKHFKRYLAYEKGLGEAVASTTDLLAGDPRLRAAVSGAGGAGGPAGAGGPLNPDAYDAPHPSPPPSPPPGGEAPRPALGGQARAIAEDLYKTVSGKNALRPDLFLLFNASGDLLWAPSGSPVAAEELREMKVLAEVKAGGAFLNKVLLHGGHAYRAAGVPIRDVDGVRWAGGLLIGVRLERYMQQFKEQSEEPDKEANQYRMTLIAGNQVVASVIDEKQWPELIKQVDEKNWVKIPDGEKTRPAIKLKAGTYDFTTGEVEGIAGAEPGVVGKLYLFRLPTTADVAPPVVPWTEIAVGIGLSVLIALLLALWITRPIKLFVRQSRRMLEGETDLTQRINVSSRDEVGDLAENINTVFSRLYALATEVQSAAFQVGASSAEISAASKQMLGGLKDQTLKIEGSTAAVTELSASIQQVAHNAAEATDVAEKSNVAVTAAVKRMQQIRAFVEDAGEKMKDLGDSSKRIGNIVEVIRQISEQTSLLALNASIEAAHAGEQGRGFAVVADEVSSLARRVGQSAKDIEALIQTIKEQTAAAVTSMEVGTTEVEDGTALVTSTLTDLGQLISVVKDTAGAVQEQAVVSDEIARNMDAVQKIAAEVLSGSEESVVQAETLHALAFNLEQSIGGFNLEVGSGSSGNGASRKNKDNGRRAAAPAPAAAGRQLRGGAPDADR